MRYLRISIAAVLVFAIAAFRDAQADRRRCIRRRKRRTRRASSKTPAPRLKRPQTDPNNAEAFLLLGQVQYQLGQTDEALQSWKKTLALAPSNRWPPR